MGGRTYAAIRRAIHAGAIPGWLHNLEYISSGKRKLRDIRILSKGVVFDAVVSLGSLVLQPGLG